MTRLHALSPAARLALAALLAVLAGVAFMTWNVRAGWAFTLPFRGEKLLAIVLVGYCIAVSTVLFQTLTHNRILTPGIMGFDALYILLQSVLVFGLGNLFYVQLNPQLKWLLDVAVMTGAVCALYYWLFVRQRRDLHLLVLVGLIFGVLFRSFTSLLTRMMDPAEFDALQDVMFASFNRIDGSLLGISALVAALVSLPIWRARHAYDVLALGDDPATSLGLEQRRLVMRTLVGIAILVAIATALVGPVTFFGLLVANLAYALAGTHQHRYLLPLSGLLAVIILLGGQALLEHLLHFGTGLSILIEFGGGLFFILLLIRQGRP